MQELNYGRIEGLVVRGRQPRIDPAPTTIRELKFGAENGPRPERQVSDFLLKAQVVELFALFDQLEDGVIDVLEIKGGLPFRVLVRDAAA
jgi:hypothetical protein